MKTALEQLESWIEQFYKINGTPTLDDIKVQINLLKDYETEQLAIPRVSQQSELLKGDYRDSFIDWKNKYFEYKPKTYEYKSKHSKERYTLTDLHRRYERAMLESPFNCI